MIAQRSRMLTALATAAAAATAAPRRTLATTILPCVVAAGARIRPAATSAIRVLQTPARPHAARWHSTSPTPTSSDVTDAATRECYLTYPSDADSAGIALLTLNRPAAKNALSRGFLTQLRECLDYLRDPATSANTRVVVVHSAVDKVFCAGADLKERKTMTPAQVAAFVTQLRETFSLVAALPMPTIAALDGAALGGGLELAMCCDLRTAGPGAKLGLPETKLAIIPGAGGSQRLPRLVGVPVAKELMFTGKVLSAAEAKDIRLVNRVGDESGLDAAMQLAKEIAPQGPVALKMAKWAIDKGAEVDLASGLKIEELCYAQVIPTQDRLEGLKAFAEKRKPVYRGE